MAGVDKQFEGTAVPMPGASIGYLPQEPNLEGTTVMDNINLGTSRRLSESFMCVLVFLYYLICNNSFKSLELHIYLTCLNVL